MAGGMLERKRGMREQHIYKDIYIEEISMLKRMMPVVRGRKMANGSRSTAGRSRAAGRRKSREAQI